MAGVVKCMYLYQYIYIYISMHAYVLHVHACLYSERMYTIIYHMCSQTPQFSVGSMSAVVYAYIYNEFVYVL